MNNSNQELKSVSKAGNVKTSARRELEALFNDTPPTNNSTLTEERAMQLMEAEMQKLGIIPRPVDARTRASDLETREREMSLRERQAGVNTSKAITGVLATWAVIGTAMLARSCINFDNSPKFQVTKR